MGSDFLVLGLGSGFGGFVVVGLCQLTIACRLAWPMVEVDTDTIRMRNLRTTTVDRSDVLAVGEETVGVGPWKKTRAVVRSRAGVHPVWALDQSPALAGGRSRTAFQRDLAALRAAVDKRD
jgi:hypothetical protein